MLINTNKGIRLIRNILFFSIVGIWLTMDLLLYMGFDIGNYLTDPLYYSILKPLRYLSYAFCVALQTYRKKDLIIVIPVSAILFISGRLSGSNTLFYLWLFILMAKEINFHGIALEAALILFVGTAFFAALVVTGTIPEYYIWRVNGTVGHALGYCHPNCLSQAIVIFAIGYGCIRKTAFRIWDYILLIGLTVFIWIVPKSRTAVACLVLYIAVMALEPFFLKLWESGRDRFTLIMTGLFAAGTVGMILLCVFYDPGIGWMRKLDSILSLRLSFCRAALDEFGISLFGQQVYLTPSERSYAGLADLEERIVDVAYVHIMLRNGLIPMLLLVIGIASTIWYTGRNGNYAAMAMMFTGGIFGTSENLYRNTAFCFFIIAVSEVLFHKKAVSSGENIGGDSIGSGSAPGAAASEDTSRDDEIYLPDVRRWFGAKAGGSFVPVLLFSLLFGFCASLGKNILRSGSFSVSLKPAILYAGLCAVCMSALLGLTGKQIRPCYSDSRKTSTIWCRFFILLLACYGICFLAYYPGVGMNDGLNILFEGVTTSRYMPSLYVAFVVALGKIGTMLGGIRYSIVLYSVIQLAAAAGFTAAFITWSCKKRLLGWVRALLIVYFALSPLLALYAISMVKDTFFSLALTAVCLALSDVAAHREYMNDKRFWPVFILLCVITIVFRNNGSYIVLALAVVLLLIYRKHWKGITALILAALLTMGASKVVKTRFHSEQLFQESVAIPLQQICRVIAEDGEISEEQLAFMDELLPVEKIRKNYDPYCADYIKWDLDFDHELLNERKVEFMKLWWELLPKNLTLYVKAWLQETFWFWAPVQEEELQVFYTIEGAGNDKPLQQFCVDNGIQHTSLLPDSVFQLLNRYYTLSSGFLREGVCFWIFAALALVRLLHTRKLVSLLDYLPVFLLWGTIMISAPISDSFRYVLVYAYVLPLYAAELFETGNHLYSAQGEQTGKEI